MYGLGTLINAVAIVVGGIFGLLFGKLISDKIRDTLCKGCGIAVVFIGISGALKGMLSVGSDGKLVTGGEMLLVTCLCLGGLVGELIDIEGGLERFAAWLKKKTGSENDSGFIDGFLTTTFTICIGAMAIVGAINDALYGDLTLLITKSILDLTFVMIMAASRGKGAIFSAIPVVILQGSVTALALLVSPIMTDAALQNLSLVGNALIFCVGINIVLEKKIKVANMLPAIIFAVALAFLPISIF